MRDVLAQAVEARFGFRLPVQQERGLGKLAERLIEKGLARSVEDIIERLASAGEGDVVVQALSRAIAPPTPPGGFRPPVLVEGELPLQTPAPDFERVMLQARQNAERGNLRQATHLAQVARQLRPDSPWVHLLLGDIAREVGDEERAALEYRRALRGDPGLVPAQLGLGRALLSRGEHAEALVHLERAVQLLRALPPESLVQPLGISARDAQRFAQQCLPVNEDQED